MKKILVMALCVTAVISMTSCGQTKSQETNSAKQAVSSTAVKADSGKTESSKADSGKTESSKADVSESVSSVTEAEYDPAKDLALLGGWAAPDSPAVTDEIRSKLEKALKGLTGAEYEPVAYLGSQVVAGMNYRLLCLVKPVTPDAKQYYAVVTLYESLDGEVSVSEVQKCDKEIVINGLAGGWFRTETPEVTKEAEAVLEKALEGLAGADYNPTALLATQVVAGTNYCYLCEATPVVPNAESHYALVYVYEDLEGNAEITEVVDFENEEKTEEDDLTQFRLRA